MKSKQLAEILPIVVVFMFVLYPQEMAMVSHSILGKFVVIAIIIYYTCIDTIYGFLVCVVFLFFYQTDFANNALNNARSGWLIEEGIENLFNELGTDVSTLVVGNNVSNYIYNPAYIEAQNAVHATESGQARSIFHENVWTEYDKYDHTTFTYIPVVSHNSENERILNAATERDLIRATFPSPGTVSNATEPIMELTPMEIDESDIVMSATVSSPLEIDESDIVMLDSPATFLSPLEIDESDIVMLDSPATFLSPAACSPEDVLCDNPLKTDVEQLMVFPKSSNEGFTNQINSIWETIKGDVSDFVLGHNQNMWKTYTATA